MFKGKSLQVAVGSLTVLIISGTLLFKYLEDWTWIQAFYFSVSTLTTVGYGDEFVPTTDTSRLAASIFILVGVGTALAALSLVGSHYIDRRTKR